MLLRRGGGWLLATAYHPSPAHTTRPWTSQQMMMTMLMDPPTPPDSTGVSAYPPGLLCAAPSLGVRGEEGGQASGEAPQCCPDPHWGTVLPTGGPGQTDGLG